MLAGQVPGGEPKEHFDVDEAGSRCGRKHVTEVPAHG